MVQQLRVVDLAGTMGITAKELIFKLRSIGVNVNSEEDTLDLGTVRAIITGETLNKRPREVIVRERPTEEPTTTAVDRLKRRRRRVVKTEREIREVLAPPQKPEDIAVAEAAQEAARIETEAEIEAVAETVVESEATVVETVTAEVEQPAVEVAAEVEAVATPEVSAEEAVETAAEVVAEASTTDEAVTDAEDEAVVAEAEAAPVAEAAVAAVSTEPLPISKPSPEVTEEEIRAGKATPEKEPKRVRSRRAHTPLEQGLRELSQDEIKARLLRQKEQEAARKQARGKDGKLKAAEAAEIRDLLHKFEEQKLKTTPEAGPGKPGAKSRRPGGRRPIPGKRRGGGRRRRDEERPLAPPRPNATLTFRDGLAPEGPIILSEMVTVKELADKLNVMVKDLLAVLISKGLMVTTNQSLPHELAEEICESLNIEAMVATVEEVMEYEREEAEEAAGPMEPRAPVVTVMGHVDHGKTSLLDSMRSSRVADGEAGGITQHVGASRIETKDGKSIVFIDTPGHEAFTQMRARGASVTDIVILVVAADDGVMPQTIEAIDHARAANVPMIVAINKIDKPDANPERLKQQLAEKNILVESWGGDVPSVNVSAKSGQGLDELIEMIMLVSEVADFKAVHEGPARGVVLEARKEKGRGSVATVIIQQGQITVGDYFFCGSTLGRVRALIDEQGKRIKTAGPSDAVEIMGFQNVPEAGDGLHVTESEAQAVEVAEFRQQKAKDESLSRQKVSLENLFEHIAAGQAKELNIVVKADVQGSVEVLKETLAKLSTDKVKINVLHASVGAITTNDVMLATASEAIIIGFSVRPERTAKDLAEKEQVDVRLYTIIYQMTEDIRNAMVGMLDAVFEEEELGQAEIRDMFRVPKVGVIAGCQVLTGIVKRNAKARLLRDNVVVWEGAVSSLRRFKEDVAEVRQGFECGIGLENYNDVKLNDVIEFYQMKELAPEL